MKKTLVLFVAFALIFTICGCQNDSAVIVDNDVDISDKINTENNNETEPEIIIPDTNEPEISTPDTADETDSTEEFSLGTITENVYTSDFIGMSYKLNDGWSFYNEQQIKEMNNFTQDIAGEDLKKAIENATIIYEMYAVSDDNTGNININLEKVEPAALLTLDIAENYKNIIPMLEETFENMGYENYNVEINEIEVDGKIVDACHINGEINGVNVYQTSFQKKCNGYLASITMTTFFENNIQDIANNITWTK